MEQYKVDLEPKIQPLGLRMKKLVKLRNGFIVRQRRQTLSLTWSREKTPAAKLTDVPALTAPGDMRQGVWQMNLTVLNGISGFAIGRIMRHKPWARVKAPSTYRPA